MKSVKQLISTLLMLLCLLPGSTNCYAHGDLNWSKTCNVLGWDIAADAAAWCLANYHRDPESTCTTTFWMPKSVTASEIVNMWPGRGGAVQKCFNSWTMGFWMQDVVTNRCCGRGYLNNHLSIMIRNSPAMRMEGVDTLEGSHLGGDSVAFDEIHHQIHIYNFHGHITNGFDDYNSTLAIKLWTPVSSNGTIDSVPDSSNTIWKATAQVLSNSSSFSNFPPGIIDTVHTDSGNTAIFLNTNIDISVPDGYSMDNLVLTMTTDGQANGAGEDAAKVLTSTNELIKKGKITFKVFPVPAQDQLTVKFDNLEQDTKAQLGIYNNAGDLISSVNMTQLTGTSVSGNINISNLKPGMYYAAVLTNGKVFLQKFVKQ